MIQLWTGTRQFRFIIFGPCLLYIILFSVAPILQYSQFNLDRIHPHANININCLCKFNFRTKYHLHVKSHMFNCKLHYKGKGRNSATLYASNTLFSRSFSSFDFPHKYDKSKYIRFQFRFFNPIKAGRGGVWRPPSSFFAIALVFVTLSPWNFLTFHK